MFLTVRWDPAPLFLSSAGPYDDIKTLLSPASGSEQVQPSCLCPPRRLQPTSGPSICHNRVHSCLLGWRGKNWVCRCFPVQEGCAAVVLVWGCKNRRSQLSSQPDIPFRDVFSRDPLKAVPVAGLLGLLACDVSWDCSPGVRFHSPSASAVQLHAQFLYPFKSECSQKHKLPACSTQLLLLIFYFFCLQLQITFKVHSAIS